MKGLFLFLACCIAFTPVASAQSDIRLEINATLPRKYAQRKLEQAMVTGPKRIPPRPYISETVDGIHYYIAFEQRTRKIKYIQTDDKKFRTVDGLYPGLEISVTKDQLYIGPWWWYVLAPMTPDGWLPVLDPLGKGDENLRQILSRLKPGEKETIKIVSFIKSGDFNIPRQLTTRSRR